MRMTALREWTTMAPESRIWVYQCNRFLTAEEEQQLRLELGEFIAQWTSHGAHMEATADILHRSVVVVALDETKAGASGCGIDKSVHFLQQWGAQHELDMLSRQTVIYQGAGEVQLTTIQQFWAMRKAELITDETLLIDPTILRWKDWPAQGWVSFKNSWHQMMWGR